MLTTKTGETKEVFGILYCFEIKEKKLTIKATLKTHLLPSVAV